MRHFFFIALIVLLSAFGVTFSAVAAERPNIVFILTDDQAPTAVGINNPELKTPHMDRLFREGARLANSFATTPSGSSSRASLLTSRYGTELKITNWINPGRERQLGLSTRFVTWPKLLASAGYRNGLVGKWHLGTIDRFHPKRHGFHFFVGFRGGGNTPKDPVVEIGGKRRQLKGFTPDVLTDHALGFIHKNRQGPFLLCLHFRAPHIDWLPVRDEDWAPYKDLDPKLPDPEVPHLNTGKLKRMTREYYASVTSVDRNIGRVLEELDKLKLADNTLVVFTSDHGYLLGHKGLWFKGNARRQLTKMPKQVWPFIPPQQRPNMFDQALRVPTAVRLPGVIKPGTVVNEVITNLDWFPTLLQLASVKLPANITVRGKSFSPLLRGEKLPWDNDFYGEYSMNHMAQTHMRTWRTPKWKLTIDYLNAGRAELYHLEEDPTESTNLIDSKSPEVQQVRKQLTKRIVEKMRAIGDTISIDLDENQRILKRLQSMKNVAKTTARGWEFSLRAGFSSQPDAKPIHATEILHLVAHKGRLFAGNSYWMDARKAGKRQYSQVLSLDGPKAVWKVDLELGAKQTRVTALSSLTFTSDGTGKAISPPVTLLLAGSDGVQQSNIWTRNDAKDTWVKTTFQQGGQYKRSTRAFAMHRDRKTKIQRIFVAAGELGIYSGVYDATQPGKIRWDKKTEFQQVLVRPMAFAEANGRLYASSGTAIFVRVDGASPRWEKVFFEGTRQQWAMGGIRGLTPITSPDGNGKSILFSHLGRIVRLDPLKDHKATVELKIPAIVEKHLGRSVKGHILAAYSSMLPVTDPATGRTVHLIGVQSQLVPGGEKAASSTGTFHGFYSGGAYLIREADQTYRVKEVNGRWMPGKPQLLAPRTYLVSPFEGDGEHVYFGGYDANFLPAVDTAWIFRASLKTALRLPGEVYELRTYTTNDGKLAKLNARFRDHTMRIFSKHGMQSVGYWLPTQGPKNALIYILKHKNRDAAQASWKAFHADPEWKKVAKQSQRDGLILAKKPNSVFMDLADYSSALKLVGKEDDGVFELRTYTTHDGKMAALDRRFRIHTIRIFSRHGMQSVGYWHPEESNKLVYLLRHKSVATAKKSWQAFAADPEWKKVAADSQKDGPILAKKPYSVFIRATDYSPRYSGKNPVKHD
jgi:choline-sulfatase